MHNFVHFFPVGDGLVIFKAVTAGHAGKDVDVFSVVVDDYWFAFFGSGWHGVLVFFNMYLSSPSVN